MELDPQYAAFAQQLKDGAVEQPDVFQVPLETARAAMRRYRAFVNTGCRPWAVESI